MPEWIFTAPDVWTPCDHAVYDWAAHLNYAEGMCHLGYTHSESSGNEDVEHFGRWTLWYTTTNTSPYPYVVALCLPDWGYTHVWLPTLPDLMAYMAKYGAVGQARQLIETLEMTDATINKLFRAWHGHDRFSLCRECDPEAYTRWQDKRQELAARKKVTP
jgi:hypothetical protein